MKNVKFIAPLALVAALASCSNGVNGFAPLKRLNYKEITGSELTTTLANIALNQFTADGELNIFDKLPSEEGTVTLNYGIDAHGKLKLFIPSLLPTIDLTDLGGGFGDTITFSWAKDKIKISDSRSTSYVAKENDLYVKYYEIDGKKYRVNITPLIVTVEKANAAATKTYNYFNNYVNVEIARNMGIFVPNTQPGPKPGLKFNQSAQKDIRFDLVGGGLGLSGFGGTFETSEYVKDVGIVTYQVKNYIAPGAIFALPTVQKYLPIIKLLNGGSYKFGSDDDKSASVNVALKDFDLSTLPGIIEGLVADQEIDPYIDASGTLSADYFVAYQDNFIKQHELIVTAKGAKISGEVYQRQPITEEEKPPVLYGTADVSLDMTLYIGQEVTNKANIETINPTDYGNLIDPFTDK